MASVVEICNMALSRIGNSQRIDSLSEQSIQAEQCSLFYEQTRDFVLRDKPWPFATKFAALAQVLVNPDPSFSYAYGMPTDCLFARKIVDQVFPTEFWQFDCPDVILPQRAKIPFRIIQGDSSRLIVTSASPATLEYTARVEDPGFFDAIFVDALSYKLGANIAPALAKDRGTAVDAQNAYANIVETAFAQGMNEGQADRMPESIFITGRESR